MVDIYVIYHNFALIVIFNVAHAILDISFPVFVLVYEVLDLETLLLFLDLLFRDLFQIRHIVLLFIILLRFFIYVADYILFNHGLLLFGLHFIDLLSMNFIDLLSLSFLNLLGLPFKLNFRVILMVGKRLFFRLGLAVKEVLFVLSLGLPASLLLFGLADHLAEGLVVAPVFLVLLLLDPLAFFPLFIDAAFGKGLCVSAVFGEHGGVVEVAEAGHFRDQGLLVVLYLLADGVALEVEHGQVGHFHEHFVNHGRVVDLVVRDVQHGDRGQLE
mmetsp:Transcript_15905/g.18426  ORF Transcript_15905/g.18426 Transcript_15905/m.18426 type:complete len:272 (-) Transcript_15905:531-1346(-)